MLTFRRKPPLPSTAAAVLQHRFILILSVTMFSRLPVSSSLALSLRSRAVKPTGASQQLLWKRILPTTTSMALTTSSWSTASATAKTSKFGAPWLPLCNQWSSTALGMLPQAHGQSLRGSVAAVGSGGLFTRGISTSLLRSYLAMAVSSEETNVPHYTLRVKGQKSRNEGTAVGFYCFEEGAPEDEAMGGYAYFPTNRNSFEAYYSAIFSSLVYVEDKGVKNVTVELCHEAVVHQLNGKIPIESALVKALFWKVMEIKEERFDEVSFNFIPAKKNKEAVEFSNKAMGSKVLVNNHFDLQDPMLLLKSTDDEAAKKDTQKDVAKEATAAKNGITKAPSRSSGKKNTVTKAGTTKKKISQVLIEESDVVTGVDKSSLTITTEKRTAVSTNMTKKVVKKKSIETAEGKKSSCVVTSEEEASKFDPSHTYILEFDGGVRGHPGGIAGAGMVFYDSGGSGDCKEEVWAGWKYLDSTVKTNNVAEYTALIEGLKVAKDKGMQKLRIYGDSKIVICQITGEFKVHDAKLKPLNKAAADLLDHFQEYEIHHHKRGFNARADSLANLAMDSLESGSSDQL